MPVVLPDSEVHLPTNGIEYQDGSVVQASKLPYRLNPILNPSLNRPYIHEKWQIPCVNIWTPGRFTVEKGVKRPVIEATPVMKLLNEGVMTPVLMFAHASALRRDEWIEIDTETNREYQSRLVVWQDLMRRNPKRINGMRKMTYEYSTMGESQEAIIDMNAETTSRGDAPERDTRSVPAYITHSDFDFSQRELAVSENGGDGLDVTSGEGAARKVAESIENQTLGIATGIKYGTQSYHTLNSQAYGYLSHPDRIQKTDFTAPTAGGWVPDTLYMQILDAVQLLADQSFSGPFRLYFSMGFNKYLLRPYSVSGGNHQNATLLSMLKEIPLVSGVTVVPRLTGFRIIIIQETNDVCRALEGMPPKTIQWVQMGGLRICFKYMTISVPVVKSSFSRKCGIVDGTMAP